MRLVFEEGDYYLDKYRPFKIARRQGDKDENLVVTSYCIRFKVKFPHVVQSIWQ